MHRSSAGLRLGMSEAQQLFGLTARALRFYEERGLIEAQRDRLNCRFFDESARRRLSIIAPLRRAGVPLPDVLRVLEAQDDGSTFEAASTRALERRRTALMKELAQVDAVQNELAARNAQLTRRMPAAA